MEVSIAMELNKTLVRINELLEQRNWTLYKLAKVSAIPYSSLNSLFQKNHQPTINTLEKICAGFHITMAEFFSDDTPLQPDTYDITPDELDMIHHVRKLGKHDRQLMSGFLGLLTKK